MNKLFKESNQKTNEVKEVTINVFGEPIVFQYTVEEMENKLLPNNKLDAILKPLFESFGIGIDQEKRARELKIKHIHARIEDIELFIKELGAKDGIELYEGSYGADIISKRAREKYKIKESAEIEKDAPITTSIVNGETKTLDYKEAMRKVFGKEEYDRLMEESRKESEKEIIRRKKENREELIEIFGEKEGAELYKRIYEDKIKSKLQKQEEELKQIEEENTIDVVIDGEVKTLPVQKRRPPKLNQIRITSQAEETKEDNNIKSERKIKILLDNKEIKLKPLKTDQQAYIDLSNRLAKNPVEITIDEFIDKASYYHAFTAANYSNISKYTNSIYCKRAENNWDGQDILVLDFDDEGMTPDNFLKRCNLLGLKPLFMYSSLRDSEEERRFRAIFLLDERLTDARDSYALIKALMEIFPETDTQCKDLARLFWGGKQLLYEDETATINANIIIEALAAVYNRKSKKNWKRDMEKFCNEVGINLINGIPKFNERKNNMLNTNNSEHEEKSQSIFSYYIDFSEIKTSNKKSKSNNKQKKEKIVTKRELKRGFDFESLKNKCPLWNGFYNGTIYPFDDEFRGIALNLLNVEGGEKKLKEAINKMKDKEQAEYYRNKISYFKSNYMMPESCKNFCPRYCKARNKRIELDEANKCIGCTNQGKNMLHAVNNKRGNIRKLEVDEERITREAAEVKLEAFIKEALESKENEIIIIDGCTGIGKTTALGNSRDLLRNTCIAYPSHKLGKDIQERLNLDAVYCKELELSNENVLNRFHLLQSIGDYSGAFECLNEYKKICSSLDTEACKKDKKNITDYEKMKEDVKNTHKAILCTHTKALLLNNNNINQYIFDEDIFYNACFKTIDVDFKELNNAIIEADRKGLKSLEASLRHISNLVDAAKTTPERVIANDITSINKDEINKLYSCNHNIKINVKELLTCRYFKSNNREEVLGSYIQNLPNKKCIILSATANEEIYKTAFPNRKVTVKHIGLVEEVGKTVLHYKSFSRSSLTNDFERHINIIKEEAPNINNIITFATKENEFKKEGFNPIAHFGNCTGLDAYKGQDLIVAGTPHVDARSYILMAKLLKKDIVIESSEFNYSNVVRNGFEFSINTFNEGCGEDTELLREIQAYFLESELVQAVGRARTLRTDATVHLFSSYPLKGCELYSA